MQRLILLITGLGLVIATKSEPVIPSVLRSAMVYRSGAELVHTATAHLEQGNNQLVIGDISNAIDASSVRIKCSSNVTILSVAVSTDYLKQESARPLVKKLQDSILIIGKQLTQLDVLTRTDNELLDLLASNKSIGSTNTGVSVAELSKMMDYYRQQSTALRSELSGYAERAVQLKDLQHRLELQIAEEEKKNDKPGGALVLQVMSPTAGPCDLTISYLTTAAHWDPSYDLKAGSGGDQLQLLYKARLVQTSGIDWKGIRLSLSTALPAQGGNAPVLKTWFLRFVDPQAQLQYKDNSLLNSVSGRVPGLAASASKSLNEVAVVGYSSVRKDGEEPEYTEPLYIVDGKEIPEAAFRKIDRRAIKTIRELTGRDATSRYGARGGPGVYLVTLKDELSDYVSVNEQQMDAVFDIDIPYDVASNGKEQGVVLKEYQLPCAYQYYAAPGVDRDAYLLGQVVGWEKLNLLPGEASIMVEGTYIGKSFIDPGSLQDTLNLTLGRDKRIVVRKEKVTDFSSVKFLGSNKKQIFTYELTVRNNKKEKVSLLLKDQYPISSDKDIEEELLDAGGAGVNKDTGILTWKLELAPGESRKFRISYSVKYPKDKFVNMN
ncbi:MAG TPA: DUF4139 domain-containing protein [Puia sp.]|nr:DUF4139 domain-containing protein [Puia sp.]